MKSTHALLAATMMLSAACAGAQTQAPGLWEHTFKMTSPGGEMEKAQAQMQAQLAAMPPEKRQQVEEMMASRGVTMGAQGTVTKVCVSKEQAAKPAEPHMPGVCSRQDVTRSGNKMKYRFECSKPRPMKGEGEMTFVSDKAWSGKSTVTTQMKGQPQQMAMALSGKWLAADCGDVKPFVMPAK